MRTWWRAVVGVCLMVGTHAGAAGGQDLARPALLVAPFGSSAGPNMASGIEAAVRGRIDTLELFEPVDWASLLDSSPLTRSMPPDRRAELTCINARQLAAREGIDAVLCGRLDPTPDGVLLELDLFRTSSGERVRLESVVATDREALIRHTLEQLRAWGRAMGGS